MNRHAASSRESGTRTVEVSRLPGTGLIVERPRRRLPSVLAFLIVLGLVATGTVYGLSQRSDGADIESESIANGTGSTTSQSDTAAAKPGYTVYDDFSGTAGDAVADDRWSHDVGQTGWGNNEKQNYTDSTENSSLDGDGHMVVNALRNGDGYTSARVTTKDKFEFTYGRIEARIEMPAGAGLHPAFWMLGTDLDSVGWPLSGEIDIMETLNQADQYHTGIHAPQPDSLTSQKVDAGGIPPEPLSENFHTYWVERSPGRVTTGIDDTTLATITPADLIGGADYWVFDKPFFLLFNVAVAGDWPGPTDDSTPFPATMMVDWVRYRAD
ncbi:glycoside hydrolase family 16 protein [Rhodococcoides navarretei]|uniref:Glycoside hydrolase family 16 protein n=1 Tax=Rhodococcus navarretei TaxID=3128981 RepID=A0ABU9D1Q8_9NOCA